VHGTRLGECGERCRGSKRLVEVPVEEDRAITKTNGQVGEGGREGDSCDLFRVNSQL
jgi:hypothetical protein